MSYKKLSLTLALLTSTSTFAEKHIRLDNGINIDTYEIEAKANITEQTAGIFNVQSNNETEGFEYSLALAYAKYMKPFNKRLIGEFDFGVAYETTGESFGAYANILNTSDDFQDTAGALWGTAALNYFVLPNFIANIDLTASQDIYNESIVGMYRTRAKFIYQPINNVNLIYRAGLTYAQSDVTKQIVKAGSIVSDDYFVSHEFYLGYASKYGLEPYFMFEDMGNDSHYDVNIGFYYRFK